MAILIFNNIRRNIFSTDMSFQISNQGMVKQKPSQGLQKLTPLMVRQDLLIPSIKSIINDSLPCPK